jgi:ABC-type multidrug transport system fused ATPase/permease subunit
LSLSLEPPALEKPLIHLLERFYDVEEGAILVDRTDIHQWDVAQLDPRLEGLSWDTFLFSGH